MKTIRIVVADDHQIVRNGLRSMFLSSPEFELVGEASSGEEAIALTREMKPDVSILDISMPGLSGIEAARRIKQENPNARILMLTIHDDQEYVYQIVRADANGYILKNAGCAELFAAVKAVASGNRFFSPSISELMIDQFFSLARQHATVLPASGNILTPRESEILRFIAEGLTSQQIAKKLFLSPRTIDTHRTNLIRKLNIHDTAGLVRYAIETGLVSTDPPTRHRLEEK